MAQRKPYNPHTKYGRKKLREEAARNFEELPPEKKAERQFWGCVVTIVVLVIFGLLVFLAKGEDGLLKWLK